MTQDERSAEARWLCPICDLIHRHEVEMEVDETKDPAVRCPCPGCKTHNREWKTVDEYHDWLSRYMPAIQEEAASLPERTPDETEDQRQHRHELEDLTDERQWDIKKEKREGTYQQRSAWGKYGPPD